LPVFLSAYVPAPRGRIYNGCLGLDRQYFDAFKQGYEGTAPGGMRPPAKTFYTL